MNSTEPMLRTGREGLCFGCSTLDCISNGCQSAEAEEVNLSRRRLLNVHVVVAAEKRQKFENLHQKERRVGFVAA